MAFAPARERSKFAGLNEAIAGARHGCDAIWRPPEGLLTDDELAEAIEESAGVKIERGIRGELIITGGPMDAGSAVGVELGRQFGNWRVGGGNGLLVESSQHIRTGRGEETNAPDLAWWSPERAALIPPRSERRGYPRVLPTFVVEIRSLGQSHESQRRKMEEWIKRGVVVGWLLDVHDETLTVFRRGAGADPLAVEAVVHRKPDSMHVGDEMPGCEIDLREIWTWKDL